MLYHHSYYGVSPLPLPNVISFTTTISTTSASLYHSCILDHCFFGLPLFVWTTTTLWIATIFLDYRCIYVSNKAVCDPNFRFLSQTALQGCDYKSLPNPAAVVCGWVTRNAGCLLRRESVRTMKSMSSMYVFMYLRLS